MDEHTPASRFQQEVMRSLGRIEGTLESLLTKQAQQDREHGKLSGRVNVLENKESRRAGATAVIATLVSAGVALMVAWVRGLLP